MEIWNTGVYTALVYNEQKDKVCFTECHVISFLDSTVCLHQKSMFSRSISPTWQMHVNIVFPFDECKLSRFPLVWEVDSDSSPRKCWSSSCHHHCLQFSLFLKSRLLSDRQRGKEEPPHQSECKYFDSTALSNGKWSSNMNVLTERICVWCHLCRSTAMSSKASRELSSDWVVWLFWRGIVCGNHRLLVYTWVASLRSRNT